MKKVVQVKQLKNNHNIHLNSLHQALRLLLVIDLFKDRKFCQLIKTKILLKTQNKKTKEQSFYLIKENLMQSVIFLAQHQIMNI